MLRRFGFGHVLQRSAPASAALRPSALVAGAARDMSGGKSSELAMIKEVCVCALACACVCSCSCSCACDGQGVKRAPARDLPPPPSSLPQPFQHGNLNHPTTKKTTNIAISGDVFKLRDENRSAGVSPSVSNPTKTSPLLRALPHPHSRTTMMTTTAARKDRSTSDGREKSALSHRVRHGSRLRRAPQEGVSGRGWI